MIAIGHKILIASYFILKDQVAYRDLGVAFLENKRKTNQIHHHIKRLSEGLLWRMSLVLIPNNYRLLKGRFLLEVEISKQRTPPQRDALGIGGNPEYETDNKR